MNVYGPSTPLLDSIRTEGASLGITVSVQPSDYSLQQLTTASQMVFTQAAAGEWAGFQVDAVEALSAADDGLTIDGTYTSVPPADRAPQVNSLATTIDGVPATIVPGTPAGLTDGRDDDYSPFDAGGFMRSNYGGNGYIKGEGCSSGFSLEFDGTSYATTARHCIYEGSDNYGDWVSANWYNQNAPSQYHYGGDGLGVFSSDGGGAILTGSGASASFAGAWDTSSSKHVEKLSNVGLNDLVCTEGGNSGGHCNIKVTNMLDMFNDGDGDFETIKGDQQTYVAIANMQGDSGGPVIVNLPDGNVGAAGMIQGYDGGIIEEGSACAPADYIYATIKCASTVVFSSMTTIINNLPAGWSLLTS